MNMQLPSMEIEILFCSKVSVRLRLCRVENQFWEQKQDEYNWKKIVFTCLGYEIALVKVDYG